MNLLVVDDDVYCAEGIKADILSGDTGIDQVYTAYSLAAGIEVLEQEDIEIVITDIELLQGDGFDLLEWMNQHDSNAVTVMLTSYAVFDYAKKAVEYHCLDYLLKPVSRDKLLETVSAAIDEVISRTRNKESEKLARYWNGNERHRVSQMLREVLYSRGDKAAENIGRIAQDQHIILAEDSRYLPVMFSLHAPGAAWELNLRERIQREVFQNSRRVAELIYEGDYLCILAGDTGLDNLLENIRMLCQGFVDRYIDETGQAMSVYMGVFIELSSLREQVLLLENARKNNVTETAGVFGVEEGSNRQEYEEPAAEQWLELFSRGEYQRSISSIENYLDIQVARHSLNYDALNQIFHDFMQAFYSAMDARGIQAHLLFVNSEGQALYDNAARSVRGLKAWVRYIVNNAEEHIEVLSDDRQLIHQVRQFIMDNLSEDLGRDDIAAHFCLSPDYFSQLFHQKTGIKLVNYVTDVRMEAAEHMLLTSSQAIGDIAMAVGYGSSTYFSRVFKMKNGVTPVQFRENNGVISQ